MPLPCAVCFREPKARRLRGVPMAVDVGKSRSEGSLSGRAEGSGSWDCAGVETDYPALADSLRQLLGAEEDKPGLQGMESEATSGRSRLAAGATQGGLSYRPEVSSASAFPRARASLSGTEALTERAADGSDGPRPSGHRFLSSEEQQVRGLYVRVLLHQGEVPGQVQTCLSGLCQREPSVFSSQSLPAPAPG